MEYQCLRWEQLPQIALYMDQVLLVLNQALAPLNVSDTPAVTSTMINNYVKMKLAAPAEKKKYDREHMARFMMICLLKKVLSMTEIAALLEKLLTGRSLEEGYGLFCRELELRLLALDGPDGEDCPDYLAAAVRAVACKIAIERMLGGEDGMEPQKIAE